MLAGASLILQQVMIADEGGLPLRRVLGLYGMTLLSTPLRNLLVSDILVRFCEQIPYAFVVLWCVSINKITPLQFGLLTTVEMVTAMLVYIPVAYLADREHEETVCRDDLRVLHSVPAGPAWRGLSGSWSSRL